MLRVVYLIVDAVGGRHVGCIVVLWLMVAGLHLRPSTPLAGSLTLSRRKDALGLNVIELVFCYSHTIHGIFGLFRVYQFTGRHSHIGGKLYGA